MQNLYDWIGSQLTPWNLFGYAGQTLFMMRFIVQWVASERARKSVIPDMFWYFSLGGGLIVLIYAIHEAKPVFILGQLPGVIVYSRNLWLIHKHKKIGMADADA